MGVDKLEFFIRTNVRGYLISRKCRSHISRGSIAISWDKMDSKCLIFLENIVIV